MPIEPRAGRNTQSGFSFFFPWPVELAPGVTAPVEIVAEIEPDEDTGNADWWVAELSIAETGETIARSSDLARALAVHCTTTYGRQIHDRWTEWRNDRPRPRVRGAGGWALP